MYCVTYIAYGKTYSFFGFAHHVAERLNRITFTDHISDLAVRPVYGWENFKRCVRKERIDY